MPAIGVTSVMYFCTPVFLIMMSDFFFVYFQPGSDDLVSYVNVRRHQVENEKHLCSAVSRKSGRTLRGPGMCGKKTLVKCMVPH